MAQLTWRELSAPDFSSSLRGTELFANLLNRATSGLEAGVEAFDQSRTDRVNNDLALRIAGATDPEAAKALAASLATDPNARRITAQSAALAAARPGQLIAQAAQEQNLSDMQRASAQGIAADALASDQARAQAARFAGKPDLALEASINDRLGSVGFKTAGAITDALQQAETRGLGNDATRLGMDNTRLGMAQTRQNMEFARDTHNWEVSDRNDMKAGQNAFLAMQGMSTSPESALAAFSDGQFASLSPGAKMYALQQLNQSWGNIYQPQQLANAAGFAGSPAGGGNGFTMQVGGGQLPSSVRTIGDAVNYGENVLIPQTRNSAQYGLQGTGKGTSAMGAYQIVSSTLKSVAPKVFGADWKNQDFTNPQVQDRLAERIFNDSKGSAASLRAQWASLSPAQAQALVGKSWAQARDVISRGETGTSASSILGSTVGAQLRVAQDNAPKSNAGALIDAAVSGSNNPREVVSQLQAGAFKGTNTQFLHSQLDDIVRRGGGKITYGQAGVILNDALRENNDSWGVTNWLMGNSARVNNRGDRINGQYITNEIERARNGGLVQDAARQGDVSTSIQTLQAAQQAQAAAQAEYQQTAQRVAVQPGVAAQLPRLKAKLDAANAAVIRAQSNVDRIAAPQPVATTRGQPEGGSFTDQLRSMFVLRRGS